MAAPIALTDIVTLLAVLLGSIAAGIMFMRPLRDEAATPPPEQARQRGRSLPPMLGGDIFER